LQRRRENVRELWGEKKRSNKWLRSFYYQKNHKNLIHHLYSHFRWRERLSRWRPCEKEMDTSMENSTLQKIKGKRRWLIIRSGLTSVNAVNSLVDMIYWVRENLKTTCWWLGASDLTREVTWYNMIRWPWQRSRIT